MAKTKTETLAFTAGGQSYSFQLNRKSEDFGVVSVDHWWFPLARLKPQKGAKPSTFLSVCNAYRAICLADDGAGFEDREHNARTYVMARLQAHTRTRGKLAVFNDAFESKAVHRAMSHDDDLEWILRQDELKPIHESEFHDRLKELRVHKTFDRATRGFYDDVTREIFTGVSDLWVDRPEDAVTEVQSRWKRWMDSVSRGRGQLDKKRALDVHSYEAAAAFHRCYSAVWSSWLMPRLAEEFRIPQQSYMFMEHWHQQIVRRGTGDVGRDFHPFHGHVLALHPATGRFVKTMKGRELIGEWLTETVPPPLTEEQQPHWLERLPKFYTYGRLLRAYYLAFLHYDGCRDLANADRR